MLKIPRRLTGQIESRIGEQKVVMLYGTRRTGKTTLIEIIANKHKDDVLLLNGEDMQVSALLQERTVSNYRQLARGKRVIIIDEAQAVPNIGKILKLMIDTVKGITIIATGSSSFDLVYKTGEPLVGRNIVYRLFPVAQDELCQIEDRIQTVQNLEERLIYGSYPELWHLDSLQEKQNWLKEMVNSFLLKDLLMYEKVKGADVLLKLLQLIAWQAGNQVSTVELGKNLGMSKNTVERYLGLLSKVFVIYSLSGYSSNLRKEVSKSKKWYFYDNGIRNAIINNFSPLQLRNDIGQLWEQYILSERMKYNSYRSYHPQYHFWRTYDGQEIDLIEINNMQQMEALECKWQKKGGQAPAAFAKAYPDASYTVIHRNNYLDWITDIDGSVG